MPHHPFFNHGTVAHVHNKRRALIARRVAVLIADGVLPEPTVRDEADDDRPIRFGAPEAIGLTPRRLREQTAAAVAEEDALRDPAVTERNAKRISETRRS